MNYTRADKLKDVCVGLVCYSLLIWLAIVLNAAVTR